MKILIFSEEYIKITKGMFVIWVNHALEASKHHHVDIYLNHEHWAFREACDVFSTNVNVRVHRLPYQLPSTVFKKIKFVDNVWPFRAFRFFCGEFFNLIFSPFVVLYVSWCLYKIKPDAIFSHNGGWPAGRLCRWIILASALARVPKRIIIIHSHPTEIKNIIIRKLFSPIRYLQARMIDNCSTAIVTVSDSVKKSLEQKVFKRAVTRIYNGIQISTSPLSQSAFDWSPKGLAVGFVGALYSHKGAHVLLDAFKLVNLPCELALIGPAEPAYLQILKNMAELCKNKVSFLGFQKDIDYFMQKIDLLVVPSMAYESFGLVILEAMKHRKPVICSDFGGMKEVVSDGVTGFVVPAGDEVALSKAIIQLLKDDNLRRQMGEAGFRRLNEMFTSEKMGSQYNELLFK